MAKSAQTQSAIEGLIAECTSLNGRVTKLEKEAQNIGQPDESTDEEFNEFSELIGGHSSQITQICENQQSIQTEISKIQTALQKNGIDV